MGRLIRLFLATTLPLMNLKYHEWLGVDATAVNLMVWTSVDRFQKSSKYDDFWCFLGDFWELSTLSTCKSVVISRKMTVFVKKMVVFLNKTSFFRVFQGDRHLFTSCSFLPAPWFPLGIPSDFCCRDSWYRRSNVLHGKQRLRPCMQGADSSRSFWAKNALPSRKVAVFFTKAVFLQ